MKPAPARSVAARQVPGDATHAARRVIHALVRQQRFGVDGPRWQFGCHRSFIIHDFGLAIRANEHGLPVFGEILDAWDAEFVRAWLDGECERGVSVLGAYVTTELPEIVRATPGLLAHRSQDIFTKAGQHKGGPSSEKLVWPHIGRALNRSRFIVRMGTGL